MSQDLSLYQLSAELKPLEEALEAVGGDVEAVTPELVERVTELLTATRQKVDGFGKYTHYLKLTVDAIETEVERLRDRQQVFQNRLRRLKDAANEAMSVRGIAKIEGQLTTITRQKNGGRQGMKLLVEPTQLPLKYRLIEIQANMDKLRADAVAGDAEALKYVEFDEFGYHVRIK